MNQRTELKSYDGWIEGIRGSIAYLTIIQKKHAWELQVPVEEIRGNPKVGDGIVGKLYQSGRVKVSDWYAVKAGELTGEEEKNVRKRVEKELGARDASL